MSYLLSIVIPTKNRYKYLFDVVRTLVKLDEKKVEIVISDNTENNQEIKSFLKKLNRPNIFYYHNIDKLSQTGNSDYAVSKCTGEYICYIGDDDTVTKRLVFWVEWMKKNKVDAINFTMAGYDWPDVEYSLLRKRKRLRVPLCSGTVTAFDTNKVLVKELRQSAQTIRYLPRIYHGVLSKKVANQIFKRSSCYFPGPSPDMANAVAAALCIKKHYFIDEPLIISGVGYDSAAGKGLRGAHKGKIKDSGQLDDDVEDHWDIRIPKVWVGNTIWLQSAEESLKKMGAFEKYKKYVDYYTMYARVYIKHKEYRPLVLMQCKTGTEKVRLCIHIIREVVLAGVRKIEIIARNRKGIETNDIVSIVDAFDLLSQKSFVR